MLPNLTESCFVCLGNICRSPAAEIISKKWSQNKVGTFG
ncbi:hypothetical protein [Akkermansia muciniphila]|nr:hypothetical protein CUB96_00010 [Akkermansia muciniphila]